MSEPGGEAERRPDKPPRATGGSKKRTLLAEQELRLLSTLVLLLVIGLQWRRRPADGAHARA